MLLKNNKFRLNEENDPVVLDGFSVEHLLFVHGIPAYTFSFLSVLN